MTTTTSYGTWTKTNDGTLSIEDSVTAALGEFTADYDVPPLVDAYRDAINDALPGSVSLCGNEFYGPAYTADQNFDGYPLTDDGDLDIAAIIEGIDFWAIAARHDNAV